MDPSQSVNWTLINEMANALTDEQRNEAEWRIRNTSKLHMGDFKIAIGFLFGLAAIAFFGRITIRLMSRRQLYRDDALLAVGFTCLTASTALFYERARIIYLVFALIRGDEIAALIASQHISDVYAQMNWSFAYITFLWTTIFMVKLCYFAFFRSLLHSMPKTLTRYYWFAVIITIIAWIYLVLQQLISCPYFGSSSSRCFPKLPVSDTVLNFTFWTGPVLDGLTDITIISIPIIVLRKSQMALITKIGFGVFLCLSMFMLACSITRAAGTYYQETLDTPWQVFWLHAEACVSVLMASITVYRSVLVGTSGSSYRFQQFIDKVMQIRTSNALLESQGLNKRVRFTRFLISKIPNATLTGLGTLFGQSNDGAGANVSTSHSAFEMTRHDYHDHLKSLQPVRSQESRTVIISSNSPSQESTTSPVNPEHSPNRISTFFFSILFPRSQLPILQHRTTGNGNTRAGGH